MNSDIQVNVFIPEEKKATRLLLQKDNILTCFSIIHLPLDKCYIYKEEGILMITNIKYIIFLN